MPANYTTKIKNLRIVGKLSVRKISLLAQLHFYALVLKLQWKDAFEMTVVHKYKSYFINTAIIS